MNQYILISGISPSRTILVPFLHRISTVLVPDFQPIARTSRSNQRYARTSKTRPSKMQNCLPSNSSPFSGRKASILMGSKFTIPLHATRINGESGRYPLRKWTSVKSQRGVIPRCSLVSQYGVTFRYSIFFFPEEIKSNHRFFRVRCKTGITRRSTQTPRSALFFYSGSSPARGW